jgi:hypothetical protein
MNTAQPYSSGASLDLPISLREKQKETSAKQDSIKYFGSEKSYKKSKKILVWFSLSALIVFIATGIYVF